MSVPQKAFLNNHFTIVLYGGMQKRMKTKSVFYIEVALKTGNSLQVSKRHELKTKEPERLFTKKGKGKFQSIP